MLNICVTGASGFIGSNLLELLKDNREYRILALYNSKEPVIKGDNIEILEVDFGDTVSIEKAVSRISSCDAVVHLASYVTKNRKAAKGLTMVNVIGFIYFARELIENDFRGKFIYTSGASIYGGSNLPSGEDSPVNPPNLYSYTKYIGEEIVKYCFAKTHIPYLILRISSPYGRFQEPNTVLPAFLQKAKKNEDIVIYGSGERMQDFVYVKDVVGLIEASFKHSVSGTFNIASGESITMNQLAAIIKSLTKSKSQILHSGEDPEDGAKYQCDITKLREAFNYSPLDIERGLTDYLGLK